MPEQKDQARSKLSRQPEICDFINLHKPYLKKHQIDMLLDFSETIYGFHLESLDYSPPGSAMNPAGCRHIAVFTFATAGVKGEIKFEF